MMIGNIVYFYIDIVYRLKDSPQEQERGRCSSRRKKLFQSNTAIAPKSGEATLISLILAQVTGLWEGRDSPKEQEKLEARKLPENRPDSHLSGARCVGQLIL
jgi:hypothetical protein